MESRQVTVWVHKDTFSKDEVLAPPDILGQDELPLRALIEVVALKPSLRPRVTHQKGQSISRSSSSASLYTDAKMDKERGAETDVRSKAPTATHNHDGVLRPDPQTRFYFVAKPMSADLRASQPMLQVSITTNIARTFGYRASTQARISIVDKRSCSASHVELVFRDEYLTRSDMWRLVRSELAGKSVYTGQKILFLGTVKAVVKQIYLRGRTASSAYFSENTVPVFRSESARYVLFIQMSREMWDFDSEGTGEILFSRVIDEFLPSLFKKWVEFEARHLVSIVLFGRLEYDSHTSTALKGLQSDDPNLRSTDTSSEVTYRDFYRVVVTDMASSRWTNILNELKKDFLVFLRDVCLYPSSDHRSSGPSMSSEAEGQGLSRIRGQPTSALRGNILEAINIASSQFATDHIDRDLVRTGISIVVITAGTGMFEVERQLLDMTSENLTNNGISIDLVCLSNIPLHSVPLFKWLRYPPKVETTHPNTGQPDENTPSLLPRSLTHPNTQEIAYNARNDSKWSFGIPEWIHVSYWTSNRTQTGEDQNVSYSKARSSLNPTSSKTFRPRVRMYELQMMGVMELGLANISIPYLSEERESYYDNRNRRDTVLERSMGVAYGISDTSPRSSSHSRLVNSFDRSGNRRPGLLSLQAQLQGNVHEWMATYDDQLFTPRSHDNASDSSLTEKTEAISTAPSGVVSRRQPVYRHKVAEKGADGYEIKASRSKKDTAAVDPGATAAQQRSMKVAPGPPNSKISRAISFALRGLGPTPRAVASTEINVENVQAANLPSSFTPSRNLDDSSGSSRSAIDEGPMSFGALSARPEHTKTLESGHSSEPRSTSSRPISIKTAEKQQPELEKGLKNEGGIVRRPKDPHVVSGWRDAPFEDEKRQIPKANHDLHEAKEMEERPLSQHDYSISPWIKNVNPANPAKNHPKGISRIGTRGRLYPRAPKASIVNWKYLCTPASMPLTTEDFPSISDWQHQYTASSYVVSPKVDYEPADASRHRECLLREMIGVRFSHGYQIAVGRNVCEAIGLETARPEDFFMEETLPRDGVPIYMSMGKSIQRLICIDSTNIQVTLYVRKPPAAGTGMMQFITYEPVVRTILSNSYSPRNITLKGLAEEYPWSLADFHLAGHQDDSSQIYERLRFCRARFVAIPFEPPASARRPIQSMGEDNEEEIHLLGIRELTRMWQKIRYTIPEERPFKRTAGRRNDPNPLEITFQTLNPSEVVATEIEKLLSTDEGGDAGKTQLLSDWELLERSTSSLPKIAQVLQSERGVDIAERRWHLRLHHSCFKGDDLTNWLLSNFKDIECREEAVDFGNELMQHGLFHHVSTRHIFKDGNYFYTIAPEYRLSQPESRSSWFPGSRRSDRSVPVTPIVESGSYVSLASSQIPTAVSPSRPADSRASEKGVAERKQMSVPLTKMMRIDVDHRNPKRSDRPEIVDLYYDRLHNPENCYHLELSWLNVTSKLIEDAIVNWATQLEKYGLRLAEVPIAEACSITDREPFREPYRISVKVPLPSARTLVGGGRQHWANPSLGPQTGPSTDKLAFQKQLLKKFDFVLDLEAASEFPPDVDIVYTWGKFDYRHSQYVHRSGVVLAQLTDEGDILLLANELYNNRPSSTKDTIGRPEVRSGSHLWPASTCGGFGMNPQHQSPFPSPLARATNDSPSAKDVPNTSGTASTIMAGLLREELEAFCHDEEKLQTLYEEISERAASLTSKKSRSTSPSTLGPVSELGPENSIPDLRLPASVVTMSQAALKSLGAGLRMQSSPQQPGQLRPSSELGAVDPSRRSSDDVH